MKSICTVKTSLFALRIKRSYFFLIRRNDVYENVKFLARLFYYRSVTQLVNNLKNTT